MSLFRIPIGLILIRFSESVQPPISSYGEEISEQMLEFLQQ